MGSAKIPLDSANFSGQDKKNSQKLHKPAGSSTAAVMQADPAGHKGAIMKKIALTLAGTLILLTAACSQQPASTGSQSSTAMDQSQEAAPAKNGQAFTGEIMDSMCAGMGGHDQMLQSGKVKNAKECTLECVKMGAKFVLYNPETKTTYQLDDQTKPVQFAGDKVTVDGTLDSSTNMIHVENITAAAS